MIKEYAIEMAGLMMPIAARHFKEGLKVDRKDLVDSYQGIIEDAPNSEPALISLSFELTDLLASWQYLKDKFEWREFSMLGMDVRKKLLEEELEARKGQSSKSARIIKLRNQIYSIMERKYC